MIDFNEIQASHHHTYSQNGQDGILQYLFEKLGVTNKFCVEFGFNSETLTGGSGSNTARLLIEDGWRGVLFDSDFSNESINLHKEILTLENIGEIFKKYEIPTEPDYISIDVDSCDLWLMKGLLLAGYRPRVMSVEYNINFPLEMSYTCTPDTKWVGDMVYGASLMALDQVAEEFGYCLTGVMYGGDAFFVRKDLLEDPISAITYCNDLVEFPAHPATTIERLTAQLVDYPSMVPISLDTMQMYPTIFRLK